jgi:hypothetical protein
MQWAVHPRRIVATGGQKLSAVSGRERMDSHIETRKIAGGFVL